MFIEQLVIVVFQLSHRSLNYILYYICIYAQNFTKLRGKRNIGYAADRVVICTANAVVGLHSAILTDVVLMLRMQMAMVRITSHLPSRDAALRRTAEAFEV